MCYTHCDVFLLCCVFNQERRNPHHCWISFRRKPKNPWRTLVMKLELNRYLMQLASVFLPAILMVSSALAGGQLEFTDDAQEHHEIMIEIECDSAEDDGCTNHHYLSDNPEFRNAEHHKVIIIKEFVHEDDEI